ncbi:MAG: NFACT family protein [Candidatus Nanoarchaeia archaeon]
MSYDLSGVDVFFLVKELKKLEGSKVDKIVQIDKKLFLLRFFLAKEKTQLRILVPDLVNLTQQKYSSPLTPLGFCTFLRKYLQNTRLISVNQPSFERILLFEFESSKHGALLLILELFKPGNMVLCKRNEEDKLIILNSLERQEFKTRKVEARQEYVFPPEKTNPTNLSANELMELLNSTDKTLGKLLATDLSLGGAYAEEIIVRSGLDKTETSLSATQATLLSEEIKKLFSEIIACVANKERVFPINMKSKITEQSFDSFSDGLDSVDVKVAAEEKKTGDAKKKKSKTESLLEIQQKRIISLEKEIKEAQACGEFIYEHYQEFQKLLDFVRDLRINGKSYDEIELELQNNKHFKKIDKANKKIHMVFTK